MKKIIFLMFAIFLLQKFYQDQTTPTVHAKHDEVILYATEWCGYCKKTREFFAENNIQYVEYDIERTVRGRDEHEALGGGGVPVIDIKGTVVHGYNVRKMTKVLKAHQLM